VPFHVPAVPLETVASAVNTLAHKRDAYHPSESGDHSKRCTLIGEGSMGGGGSLDSMLDDGDDSARWVDK
jgi:hypothetical protein